MTPPPHQPKPTYKIACIGGDGIGPEVISAGVEVLRAICASPRCGFDLEFHEYDWSSDRYLRTGRYIPDDDDDLEGRKDQGLNSLKEKDAILFGSVGTPSVPDHISLWGLRLSICQPLQMYANVRPSKILPGISSPLSGVTVGDLDWLIIRENSEGEYSGHGGRSHLGQDHEVATEVSIFTRSSLLRIMRFAFSQASLRPRKLLTVVTKSNAQRNGMVLWDQVASEVSTEFPDVRWDRMLVDAMTVRMVRDPASLDTIVATNLHADILSDLAAALSGSIGIAPTANLDPTRRNPSMFEPIHGSATDIVGKGLANPVGTFWSSAMMLDWLGETRASQLLLQAIRHCCQEVNVKTPDVGGSSTTGQVTQAMIRYITSNDRLLQLDSEA